MKKALINLLKVLLPLAIGVWLIFKQYNDLDAQQRQELFDAFRQADLWVLVVATIVGWLEIGRAHG